MVRIGEGLIQEGCVDRTRADRVDSNASVVDGSWYEYYYLSRCSVLMNARDWKLVFRNHRIRQWMPVYLTFLFAGPAD
jgi:hypothetical protein